MNEARWTLTPFDQYVDASRDKLNDVERQVFENCPALQRIATAQRPVAIEGWIRAAHNPDGILLDAIYVEIKGFVRSSLYRPILKNMPPWLKRRYHLMICNSSEKEALKMVKFCVENNVSWSRGTTVPGWLVLRAMELGSMTNDPSVLWLP
jgi:hypothetical protein